MRTAGPRVTDLGNLASRSEEGQEFFSENEERVSAFGRSLETGVAHVCRQSVGGVRIRKNRGVLHVSGTNRRTLAVPK